MTEYTTIERQIVIDAAADRIVPHISDFTRWVEWSPWEGADREMQREYRGTQGEVGAYYAWNGNRKAGAGNMEVTKESPEGVDIALVFTRPFTSWSQALFTFAPEGSGTRVTWTMKTPKTAVSRIMGVFMNMDKIVGADFEKGLSRLKTVVEA